jgi:hypothetical protein
MVAGFKTTDEHSANWIQTMGQTVRDDWNRSNVQVVARNENDDILLDIIVKQGQIIDTIRSEAARDKVESKRRYEEMQKQFHVINNGLTGLEGLISDWIRSRKIAPVSPRKRASLAAADSTNPDVADTTSTAADSASEEAALMEQDDSAGSSADMLVNQDDGVAQQTATTPAVSSTPSSAGTIAAWSSVIVYNEINANAKIDTNQVLHQVFAKYHEYRMHCGTPLRVESEDNSDESRVRMVIAWLTAVASDEQKASLRLRDPPDLVKTAMALQDAFMTRLNAAELTLLKRNVKSRKLTAGAIESRIKELEKLKVGFRELIKNKKVDDTF